MHVTISDATHIAFINFVWASADDDERAKSHYCGTSFALAASAESCIDMWTVWRDSVLFFFEVSEWEESASFVLGVVSGAVVVDFFLNI